MSQEHLEQFDKQWSLFITHVKGQVKKRSQKGIPTFSQMNVILKDCALDWDSNDNLCGRWLANLKKEMPEKSELIRQILVEDMHFREDSTLKGMSALLKTAIPVAGAVAGLTISRVAGATMMLQLLSAAGAAAILTPAIKTADQQVRDTNTSKSLQAYLEQLELYRISVVNILNS